MSHEILHPAAQRRRQLPDRDASAYKNLRLVVQLERSGTAQVSLIFVSVGGGRLADTRIGTVRVSTLDEKGDRLPPLALLRRALDGLDQ